MKSQHLTGLSIRLALTLGIAVLGSTRLSAQGCQPVDDAMRKIFTTPTHLSSTTMLGGQPIKTELIYAGGVIYENVHGKWSRSALSLEQVIRMEDDNRRNSKMSCRYLRDESVTGETAALYSTHAERADVGIQSDGQVWISKSKGLPLRHEEDIDDGGGKKRHHSTFYDYSNVRPPL